MEKREESEWNGGPEGRLHQLAQERDRWEAQLSDLRSRLAALRLERSQTKDLKAFKELDDRIHSTQPQIQALTGRIRSLSYEHSRLRDQLRHSRPSTRASGPESPIVHLGVDP